MRALRWTTATAIALTFVLIVLGAWVRTTGSGLSCPDWPTCYGYWLPLPGNIPADAGYSYYQVMLEWVHRLLAGVIVGPLILAIAVLGWRARDVHPRLPWYGLGLVVLLLAQAGLGGFTVLDQNSPWSVALHLTLALLLLTGLLLVLELGRAPAERALPAPRSATVLAAVVWVAVLATMASAAMTAKSGASLACATWPSCNGALVPDLSDPLVRLNFSHRLLAAVSALGGLLLWLAVRRQPGLARPAGLALGLIALEVVIGGLVVLLAVPAWAGILHQALGVLAFAAIALVMCRGLLRPALGEEPLDVRLSRARSAL